MEKKTALLCDSSADVTEEEAKELGIHVLRMPVIIEGEEYLEGVSVFDSDILEALRAQKKITTTQPSAGEIMRKWEELLQDHDEVFYLPLSRALSGTCANAIRLAKERYEGRVTVVDSTFVCYPVIYMLKAAREMLEKGYTCAQIKEKIENEGELFAILIPENLNALKNGGRISPAAAALAGMLKIHPLLKVENGGIDVQDKVRTAAKAYRVGIDCVLKDVDPEDYDWMIIHADNPKVCDQLQSLLEESCGRPVDRRVFRAVIMAHAGEGTIGFGRIRKLKY